MPTPKARRPGRASPCQKMPARGAPPGNYRNHYRAPHPHVRKIEDSCEFARYHSGSSKPVRCGSPTLGRFDSGAAPLSRFWRVRADSWPLRSVNAVSSSSAQVRSTPPEGWGRLSRNYRAPERDGLVAAAAAVWGPRPSRAGNGLSYDLSWGGRSRVPALFARRAEGG